MVFFDVGQGEAIFIETPENIQILIDGGPSKKILEKLSGEMPFWDRSLDLVVLTHPERDHLEGILYVLDRYKVENILWTGVQRPTATFGKWQEKLKKEEAKIILARRGQRIKAGELLIDIFYPVENLSDKLFEKESNDTSVVARLSFGENTFLLTGDIGERAEKEILTYETRLISNVLKVAHHGSKTSSSRGFLARVNPQISVISCGKNNPYGHPHEGVLSRLLEFATILRTDMHGDVKIISDGNNLKYEVPFL